MPRAPQHRTVRADIEGRYAIMKLEAAYLWAQIEGRPQQDLDAIRETIELCRVPR